MIATDGLIGRLLGSEIAYTAQRAAVIGRWPGNPFGVAVRRDGPVFACRVKGVPSPWLNRVMGLGEDAAALVPELAAWGGAGLRWETTPDRAGPEIAKALLATGLSPTGGDAMVWGAPRPATRPAHIEQVADEAAMEVFLDTHLSGLEIPRHIHNGAKGNMRGWLGRPGLVMLIARRDGIPAASCALYIADGVTYIADMATRPEHRGHGLQTALLEASLAAAAGSEIVWARCRFLSQSHRNLQRAGLRTLCTTSFWT